MSQNDLIVRFAGEGGAGMLTIAETLVQAATKSGYHGLTFATFPSQIMGGPTWMQARISSEPVLSAGDTLDVLVALNKYNYDAHVSEVRDGGIIIHDSSFEVPISENTLSIPMNDLAKKAGLALSANMVIIGAIACLVNWPLELFETYITHRFKAKGKKIIDANCKALELGFAHAEANNIRLATLPPPNEIDREQLLIKGNDALCLGALKAGVDTFVGYPISPASTILMFMLRNLKGVGKFAYQSSSEIESINAIIGASYAGKKSMTATAGPGFSLMSEGIGLAWMTETPIVIVNVQRGGPATGLPTKTEQSDLYAAMTPAHGDVRIPIIAPGTVEECFYASVKAFNWAERYQGPVILLSEHNLSERSQNIQKPDLRTIAIEKRSIYTGDNGYQRYEGTGASPMPIPGHPGSYIANASEHDPMGDTTHLPERHVQMTQRRFNKLALLNDGVYESNNTDSPIAIMPWGGSKGPALETYNKMINDGHDLAWYYTMFLHPLPPKLLDELKEKALVLVPELNYQGQFSSILRTYGINAESITQYTGLPFKVKDLCVSIKDRTEYFEQQKAKI